MGLDMYLSATKYVEDFTNSPPEEKALYRRLLAEVGVAGFKPIHDLPFLAVKPLIATWKNAYQINDWLVTHALDGEDIRCVDREVEREDLQTLMDLCQQALRQKDRRQAAKLLPAPDGLLETKEDWNHYWWHLEVTVKQLAIVFNDPRFNSWEFIYQAS